jgi:hypothetical protein
MQNLPLSYDTCVQQGLLTKTRKKGLKSTIQIIIQAMTICQGNKFYNFR